MLCYTHFVALGRSERRRDETVVPMYEGRLLSAGAATGAAAAAALAAAGATTTAGSLATGGFVCVARMTGGGGGSRDARGAGEAARRAGRAGGVGAVTCDARRVTRAGGGTGVTRGAIHSAGSAGEARRALQAAAGGAEVGAGETPRTDAARAASFVRLRVINRPAFALAFSAASCWRFS